jgi:hypothetical protein
MDRVNWVIKRARRAKPPNELSPYHPVRSRARRSFVLPSGRRDNSSGNFFHRCSIHADGVQQVPSIPMKLGLCEGRPLSTPGRQLAADRALARRIMPSGEHGN